MKANIYSLQNLFKGTKRNIIILLFLIISASAVRSQCVANFSFALGLNGSAAFTDMSTGTGTNTSYSWDFGDPLSGVVYNTGYGQTPSHLYGSNGIYSVTLSISTGTFGGCTSSFVQTITIINSPCNMPIDANWSYTTSVGTVSFTSLCTGTTGIASYFWDFGDGGTAGTANAVHTYSVSGYYGATLKVIDGGCTDSLGIQVNICSFVPNYISASGLGGSYGFTSTSTGTTGLTNYNWNFGDGGTGSGISPNHIYNTNGTYSVTLSLSDITYTNCWGINITNTISVTNATCSLAAGFSSTVNPGGLVNFASTSTGTFGGSTFSWDYGDGATGTGLSSSHTYSNGGVHNVKLVAINSLPCQDSITLPVNVNTIPCVANSNFTLTYGGMTGLWYAVPAYFGNVQNAQWSWGDGQFSGILFTSHSYTPTGNYTICLTVTTSCGTSSTCAGYNIYRSSAAIDMSMATVNVVKNLPIGLNIKNTAEENASVNIFPNPNNGKVNIKIENINGNTKTAQIEVFDILGKTVYSTNVEIMRGSVETELNLEHLSSGSYTIRIKTNDRNYLAKSIINK